MPAFLYYLRTAIESAGSVFGLRAPYEQPPYAVVRTLDQGVQIRRYQPRLAIEATVQGSNRDAAAREAFKLLFRHITGANQGGSAIAMTAPVETTAAAGSLSMRFFLPRAVAEAGAPAPLDPNLRLVEMPAASIAALRFSGVSSQAARDARRDVLLNVLRDASLKPEGDVVLLNYDPPFTIPALRRNEVAVNLAD